MKRNIETGSGKGEFHFETRVRDNESIKRAMVHVLSLNIHDGIFKLQGEMSLHYRIVNKAK